MQRRLGYFQEQNTVRVSEKGYCHSDTVMGVSFSLQDLARSQKFLQGFWDLENTAADEQYILEGHFLETMSCRTQHERVSQGDKQQCLLPESALLQIYALHGDLFHLCALAC